MSGFGGELATRLKCCRACGQDYYVHLLATTSAEPAIADGEISGLRDRISYLQQQRRETISVLLLRHEQAAKINRDAMELARKMRERHGSN